MYILDLIDSYEQFFRPVKKITAHTARDEKGFQLINHRAGFLGEILVETK